MKTGKTGLSRYETITLILAVLVIIVTIIVSFISGHDWFQQPIPSSKAPFLSSGTSVAIQTNLSPTVVTSDTATYTSAPTDTLTPVLTPTFTETSIPSETLRPTSTSTPNLSLPFVDDFNKGLDPTWNILNGQPIVVNGRLSAAPGGLTIELNYDFAGNYTIEFDVDCCGGRYGSLFGYIVVFGNGLRYNDMQGYSHGIWESFQNNKWVEITTDTIDIESPARLRFVVQNNTYRLFRNGSLVTEIVYGTPLQGPLSVTINDQITIDNFKLSIP